MTVLMSQYKVFEYIHNRLRNLVALHSYIPFIFWSNINWTHLSALYSSLYLWWCFCFSSGMIINSMVKAFRISSGMFFSMCHSLPHPFEIWPLVSSTSLCLYGQLAPHIYFCFVSAVFNEKDPVNGLSTRPKIWSLVINYYHFLV